MIPKRYTLEFILFTSYMLFAMSWVGATIFMPEIMHATGMNTLTQASTLSTSLTIAKIFGTAIAAWSINKFGIRSAFSIASLLICFSLVTPYTGSYWLLLASRFLMGLGGALTVVYFNPIIYQYFPVNERPIMNGLNAIAFNVGTAIIMFGIKPLTTFSGGWQNTLIYISAGSIIMLLLWLVTGKTDLTNNIISSSQNEKYRFIDGLKDKFNWLFAFTYAGLLSFYIVLFTFYPKAGISQVKQVILFGIIGAIAGMIYSHKYRSRLFIMRISGLIQLISAFGLSFLNNPTLSTVFAISLGFFMFLPIPALLTYAQERPSMNAQKIAVTFSIFWSVSYLIATIVPTLFAYIVDHQQGNFQLAFIFICLIESTFLIGSILLKEGK